MPPVRLSKSAERWFLTRVAELADVNPDAARRLIDRLEKTKALLSSFPRMTEKGILEGTRKVSMPPLVLTTRERHGTIESRRSGMGAKKMHWRLTNYGMFRTATMR